jgi:hypothetical protein
MRAFRECGLPINIYTARALMLGHIRHRAPDVLRTVVRKDGSLFKCSDIFVRRFLRRHLNFVPRMATRAAQKTPPDAPEQLRRSFLRIVNTTRTKKIKHAGLRVNLDQTQVVVQNISDSMFAKQGSKQVSVVGKEEKRAWTAVIAVSDSGEALPLQIIMEGKTKKVVPRPDAPYMPEANSRGFIWNWNPRTYWLSLPLMKTYVTQIIVPYFLRKKAELGYAPDHACILQLDAWSVHRSVAFRQWIRDEFPWIVLDYIPANCTGIWQPCDVGTQRPFKQAIRRAQLEDMVAETQDRLNRGGSPADVHLDKKIGVLRDRSVRWFVEAFDTIQNPKLILKTWERCSVGAFNLSFESVTSSEAIDELFDLQNSNPELWAEITSKRAQDEDCIDTTGPDAPDAAGDEEHTAECPYDADIEGDAEDSGIDPTDLVEDFIAGDTTEPDTPGLAEELDVDVSSAEVVLVREESQLGRGKRARKANQQYVDFESH